MFRRVGESLKLGDDFSEIDVTICKIYGNTVKIGINAPATLGVYLSETHQKMQLDLQQKIESYYYKTHVAQRKVNLSAEAKPQRKALENVKVLLVEDSAIIRATNREFIRSLGGQVDIAEDGRKAIDMLHNLYDLILLDIGLPDITGLAVCKWLRSHSINKNTPVIFLTAFGESMREKCNTAGGNAFAVKPLSMEKLLKLVDGCLPTKY
jgi:carbon storage regulator CsrA